MRIIAGRLGGRQFSSPRGHRTHPMSDKVRGALFNALGELDGLQVLDAFAGSGALAFEAVSRGAVHATAIDSDRVAQAAISQNIQAMNLQPFVKLIKASANAWLATSRDYFDVVLLDPPYQEVQSRLLVRLCARAKPGGTVVISLPPDVEVNLPRDFVPLLHKKYGDAELYFYRAPVV